MSLWGVLAGWCNINASESTHVIEKGIISNNSQIKCNNKIHFYYDCYEMGIQLIEHIYNFSIQTLYKLIQLQNLNNIHQNDFLKYYNIVSNITKECENNIYMKAITTYLKSSA